MKLATLALFMLAFAPVFSLFGRGVANADSFPVLSGLAAQATGVPTLTPNNRYAALPVSGMPTETPANRYNAVVTSGMPSTTPANRYIGYPNSVILAAVFGA